MGNLEFQTTIIHIMSMLEYFDQFMLGLE